MAWLVCGALVAAPVAARADWSGCVLGPSDLNRCSITGTPATALAAIAAPIIVAGAVASVAHELNKRTEERADGVAPVASTAAGAKHQPNLALVPDPPDPYRATPGHPETRHKPSAAFQFNENATNVATVVAGAAVVGALIATIAKDASSSHHR